MAESEKGGGSAARERASAAPAKATAETEGGFDREQAAEQGYFGSRPDGPDHEDYALTSGPDSPSAAEAIVASKKAEVEALEESMTEGKG
jgi:hypothetical protein